MENMSVDIVIIDIYYLYLFIYWIQKYIFIICRISYEYINKLLIYSVIITEPLVF